MPKSTAYIIASGIDYQYRFCGVTEIEYNFALNIDADLSQGGETSGTLVRLYNGSTYLACSPLLWSTASSSLLSLVF